MKKFTTKVALAALLASGIAVAGKDVEPAYVPVAPVVDINPFYVGLGLLWSGTSRECACAGAEKDGRLKNTSYGFIGRVGYDFNQYIGIEARAFKASIDKNFAETLHYGLFLKPQYQISDKLNVYGLVGYGHTEVKCKNPALADGRSQTFEKDGLSVGIGLEYDLSDDVSVPTERQFDGQGDQEKGLGVWVDYQNLLRDEGPNKIKANIVTAGVTYDF